MGWLSPGPAVQIILHVLLFPLSTNLQSAVRLLSWLVV